MNKENVNILGIETSCDETAAAVVRNGREVRSSIVASQTKLHEKFGGVVPELASRAHIDKIYPVIKEAIDESGLKKENIDAIAIANRPGLSVALMVGVTAAKTLSFAMQKPLVAIDHLHAHMQAAVLGQEDYQLPAAALIVSGGHTSLYDYKSPLAPVLLGSTIDDAAGEAFDKVASILKLPYPGGPVIEKLAKQGNPKAIDFPRSMLGKESLDFSFSGLKTAVLYHCCGQNMKGDNLVDTFSQQQINDIAASFQAAVIAVLVKKAKRAIEKTNAKTFLLGGGVAANGTLRDALEQMCDSIGVKMQVAEKRYCTDNAVMVASLAYYKYKAGDFADLQLEPLSFSQ